MRDHERRCEREREAHPRGVPFPELATPEEGFGVAGRGWGGDGVYEKADWDDDEGGCDEGDEDEGRGGDFFVDRVGEGDVGVDEGEGAVVGRDFGEEDTGYGD